MEELRRRNRIFEERELNVLSEKPLFKEENSARVRCLHWINLIHISSYFTSYFLSYFLSASYYTLFLIHQSKFTRWEETKKLQLLLDKKMLRIKEKEAIIDKLTKTNEMLKNTVERFPFGISLISLISRLHTSMFTSFQSDQN